MPIIDHAEIRLAPTAERVRERYLVSKDQGAVSLTIKEVEISPGWEGRMHTHPVDVSIQVLSGAIQVILNDEVRTGRAGTTLLAPPVPSYRWDAGKTGNYNIMSRATDEVGRVQSREPRYNNMRKNFSAIVGYPVVVE